jgi:hypothetical protein
MRGPLDSSTRLMSPEEFSRRIYCSVAEVISFDPVTGVLSIQGSVTDDGSAKTIQITASDVTHFYWDGAVKAPEGFFELSTVEIRNEGNRWLVEFEPWFTATLRFACGTLQLDGERVEGAGAWFQDSLEGPVPAKNS